ncbi:hypothetical protein V5799_023942 [Amblyomma americanum]|uniref:Uncharacterized protein n=3 Tax=Amblyomma americanum TaxID=6943 RepID=A0AAQ4FI65_AMBAM
MFTPVLAFQVLSYWLSAGTRRGLDPCPSPTLHFPDSSAPWMPEQSSAVSSGPDRPYLAPLDAFAWKPPPSTTSSITWPEATVFNLRHNVSSAGHDTDSCTMFTPVLAFQVLSYWLSAGTRRGLDPCPSPTLHFPDSSAPWMPEQSSAVSSGPDRPYLAPLDAFAWKPPPSTTSSITWPEATVFNLRHNVSSAGHDTDSCTMFTPVLAFQVLSYWLSAGTRRGLDPCPSPTLHFPDSSAPWMPEQSSAVSSGPDRPYLAPLDAFAWKPPPSTTSSITWPEATVFNLRHNVSSAGHDTDSCTMFTPVLAFQVLSYWLSAGTRRGLDPCPSPTLHFPDSSAPWMPEQSSAVSSGPDRPYLAPLDAFAWKPPPSTTSSITWPEATVFNLRHNVSSAGHDTDSCTMFTPVLAFQVSYLDYAKETRSSDRCLFAVSCPYDLKWRTALRVLCDILAFDLLSELMLLLSGDVELNPGPGPTNLSDVLDALKRLEEHHAAMRADLDQLKTTQISHETQLTALSNRVAVLELDERKTVSPSKQVETSQIRQDIAELKAANIDAKNRMRRNNLLFFGLDDSDKESWTESEEKVIALCKEKLDLNLEPSAIERAHRIGQFSTEKKRPIIVKMNHYKAKESVLACGRKLKETPYVIREDFEFATRLARSKLVQFIKPRGCSFKLRYDKLIVGEKYYTYDHASDTITETDTNTKPAAKINGAQDNTQQASEQAK